MFFDAFVSTLCFELYSHSIKHRNWKIKDLIK